MTPTGILDIRQREICVGDIVRCDNGFSGKVVFANGAFRVDIAEGEFLRYNSSLLFNESGKTQFEIIERRS